MTIRHTGIVVSNLNQSQEFYQTLFDLKLIKRDKESGEFISNLVGLSQAIIEWAKLEDTTGSIIELLQYHSHPETNSQSLDRVNRIGCNHIAFTVPDIAEFIEKYKTYNLKTISDIQPSPDGNVKVIYCTDLDGGLIEVVEMLNKTEMIIK